MSQYSLPLLPLQHEVESKVVLKKLALAHKALAELNGVAETIPNEVIILNTLSLQEAKDSSAIENIITTHDELFSSDNIAQQFASSAAKEVYNYASALKDGFSIVREKQLITCNQIIEIQSILEETSQVLENFQVLHLKTVKLARLFILRHKTMITLLR
jgi:Fic family protein